MPVTYKKVFTDETEEELLNMTREEACLNLNDKQRFFCECLAAKRNAVLAAKKAGYGPNPNTIASIAWKLRQNPDINRYLAWLKLRISREAHVDAIDIIDQYVRIAFADITDFIKIEGNRVKLVNAEMIDGQLVKSVKQGKDGITVELHDKLSALQKLERYFDIMPADWRQKLEERKVELLAQRIEIERFKSGQGQQDDKVDDGFFDALKDTAEEVWDDEE